MNSHSLPQSVRHIRRRLFGLLLQAFGLVVLLVTLLVLAIVILALGIVNQNTNTFRPTLADVLEAYYAGNGSWDGVSVLPTTIERDWEGDLRWRDAVLLDSSGVVLMDRGLTDTERVGQPYPEDGSRFQIQLEVEGEPAGTLVIEQDAEILEPLRISTSLLLWIALISFFPGILTAIMALFLARRVVMPLAEVMGAAHAVAAGDLSARIDAKGPDDLRDLIESFNRMASALQRSDRERRDMLADIAHELRTPLTVIRGRLEGIVEGIYKPDVAHFIPVLEEVYLLERLVEDLRLLTLAETRQLHLDLMPVSLIDVAQRAGSLFEAEALEKDIQINFELDPAVPPVMADPQRVGQVVHNLLSNALRYVPAHGQVTVSAQRIADGVEFIVSDNGSGIPESDLARIFDRFWRSDKSRTRSAGGAGLGLAIARQLIEAQGGSILASNRPEGGLAVGFILPSAAG